MIKALVSWKGGVGTVECQFAYPLSKGDTFMIRDGGQRVICTVEHILHVPVDPTSGDTPSVVYQVTRLDTDTGWFKLMLNSVMEHLPKF